MENLDAHVQHTKDEHTRGKHFSWMTNCPWCWFCEQHKRYRGVNRPATVCKRCYELYFYAHPEEKERYQDTYRDCEKLQEFMLKP